MKQLFCLLVLALLIAQSFSCKHNTVTFSEAIINEALGRYISAYTSGYISRADAISVKFNQDIVLPESLSNKNKPYFEITPKVEGTLIWENPRTLLFKPIGQLSPDTRYQVTLNLKQLIPEVEKDAAQMIFHFQTRKQAISLQIDNIVSLSDNNADRVNILGSVRSSDVLTSQELSNSFSISYLNQKITAQWSSTPDMLTHYFEINELNRGSKPGNLEVIFNKKPASAAEDKQLITDLTVFDNFTAFANRIVFSDEPHIQVLFTRKLDEKQDLRGLVQVKGSLTLPRMLIEENVLIIYPGTTNGEKLRLTIDAAVKSRTGQRLSEKMELEFDWLEYKPQVRISGRGNIISEEEKGVVLPIETMGLKALDVEIFQIFSGNILQFLQTADQNLENYDLARVGRTVMTKTIQLEGSSTPQQNLGWSRFGINLKEIFDFDPKSIYQIRLSFRPEYTLLSCSQSIVAPEESHSGTEYDFEDGYDYEFSPTQDYYGIYGYFDGYRWENRENPCFIEYYNRSKFVSRTLISSSIGLMAKKTGTEAWRILATHLDSGGPASNVGIKIFDFQQQLIAEGQTDGSGQVTLNCKQEPFVVQADLNGKHSFLKIKGAQSLQLSRFEVDGVMPKEGLKGFIYAEREVWRPGDSMYINFILEGVGDRNLPVTAELANPSGKLYKRIQVGRISGNLYSLHTATAPEDKTGNWMLTVKAGPAVFKKSIRIEAIKPNRLKVNYDPEKKAINSTEKNMGGTIQASWLHGTPGSGLRTDIQLNLRKQKTKFKSFENYLFDDPSRSLKTEPLQVFQGTLDEGGSVPVKFQMPQNMTPPGKISADFRVRVFEKGGDFSIDYFSMDYSPYPSYTGISLPRDRYGQNRLDLGKKQSIDMIVVDEQGKPLAGKTLDVGLYRVNWRWWWENYGDYVDGFSSAKHEEAILTQKLTSDSNGRVKWNIELDDWGRYLVRICDRDGGHCSGDFFYAGYPWYEDGSIQYDESAILEVTTDKKNYLLGEEIQLKVPAPEHSHILISIENGSTVLESSWHKASPGENLIKIKTSAAMTPNVYFNVSVIQGNKYRNPSFPLRMYGIVPVMVTNPDNQLHPEISMKENLKGGESFYIEVKEKNGKGMHYTLAIVDEGLLDITRFRTPDPYGSFFAKEALGVRTWDLYDQILASTAGESGRLLSIGGDGAAVKIEGAPKANRFKPVVLHAGPFYLEKGRKAKHDFTMPEYAGSVRVMLIAADEKKYGHAEKTVPVKQDLMVLASAPRVIRPGESFDLLLNLFSLDKKTGNVQIQIKERSGLAILSNGGAGSVSFNGKAETTTTIPVKIKDQTGSLFFDITVSGNGQKAESTLEMEIIPANAVQRKVQNLVLDASSSKDINASFFGVTGSNKLHLELSVFPAINLGANLQYLLQYPHGCLEQITSAALAQVAIGKVVPLSGEAQAKVLRQVNAVINKLGSYQRADGGFSYWPGGVEGNQWVTNYVGYFLIQAKANGYSVPANMLDKWIEHQLKLAAKWSATQSRTGLYAADDHLNQSMRLFTLALAGKPDFGAMNRFRETAEKYTESSWLLAASYGLAGRSGTGKEIVKNLSTKASDSQSLGTTFGSELRNKAIILDACTILKLQNESDALALDIAGTLNKPELLNTHSIAYGILAISRYLEENPPASNLNVTITQANKKAIQLDQGSTFFSMEFSETDIANAQKIQVANNGKGKIYIQAVTEGRPGYGEETTRSSNLSIGVRYLDASGNSIDPVLLQQGQDFIAEVKVTKSGVIPVDFSYLALSQIFPSGWEITNRSIANTAGGKQRNLTYQDIRDDRVLSYFDLDKNTNVQTVTVELTAAYKGRFYLPALTCESMYDPKIYASLPGKWVEVKAAKNEL